MTNNKVTFKEGLNATGWKVKTSNKHYFTKITVIPYYVLTNSNYVMEKIKDKPSIKIKNVVETKITDHNEETLFEESQWAYARTSYHSSNIEKKVSSVSNKKAKKQYTITWKIHAWETATSGEGKSEYIEQNSGIFYDIIPLGGDLNVKSIRCTNRKRFFGRK